MSNLANKGFRSTTFVLCAGTGAVATSLLIGGYIDMGTWESIIEMAIGGYVLRHAANVGAEAYRDKGKP